MNTSAHHCLTGNKKAGGIDIKGCSSYEPIAGYILFSFQPAPHSFPESSNGASPPGGGLLKSKLFHL